jgi:hypothetical protein
MEDEQEDSTDHDLQHTTLQTVDISHNDRNMISYLSHLFLILFFLNFFHVVFDKEINYVQTDVK